VYRPFSHNRQIRLAILPLTGTISSAMLFSVRQMDNWRNCTIFTSVSR